MENAIWFGNMFLPCNMWAKHLMHWVSYTKNMDYKQKITLSASKNDKQRTYRCHGNDTDPKLPWACPIALWDAPTSPNQHLDTPSYLILFIFSTICLHIYSCINNTIFSRIISRENNAWNSFISLQKYHEQYTTKYTSPTDNTHHIMIM